MKVPESIFREYDIRGVVGKELDAPFARSLGRAYASLLRAEKPEVFAERRAPQVGVGCDCRVSSPELTEALVEGILSGGVSVVHCGMGPTPQLYYSVFSLHLAGGIQVTGSHNPGDQNGFKIMIGEKTLSGDAIQQLKQLVLQPKHSSEGRDVPAAVLSKFDARNAYIRELISRSASSMNPKRQVRVVVDGGNGVGGLVGPQVLRELGCVVIELYTEPDGRFPNHHPDPTVVENLRDLQAAVVKYQADVGIAWDGDADRIGVVNERGEPIFGDMLLLLYGRRLLAEVERPIIIGDVKCSDLMFADLEARGARTIMWKTGHSLIKSKLQELNAHLAGEMSGHMFFGHRYYGFDDAIHASARLVEIISHAPGKLSDLLADLPPTVSTPEIRRECPEHLKFLISEKAKTAFPGYETITLDGVRVKFPHGWGLVRASNTQPVLVLRFEADSEQHLREYQRIVETKISELEQESNHGSRAGS